MSSLVFFASVVAHLLYGATPVGVGRRRFCMAHDTCSALQHGCVARCVGYSSVRRVRYSYTVDDSCSALQHAGEALQHSPCADHSCSAVQHAGEALQHSPFADHSCSALQHTGDAQSPLPLLGLFAPCSQTRPWRLRAQRDDGGNVVSFDRGGGLSSLRTSQHCAVSSFEVSSL